MNRLRELDLLRGFAIILILLRHQYLFSFTTNIGWIGVDLFFVLSGFLVSGLLFKEYQKFGDIRPKRFLIRRGFKIYPIYYLFYILYLIPVINKENFEWLRFLSDIAFVQNYVNGWGWAFAASWSLAVEEHFYFSLALFLWFGMKYKKMFLSKDIEAGNKINSFQKLIIVILVLCLFVRLMSNLLFPLQFEKNFTMTHLRIDSLLAGVYVSYLYYFRFGYLSRKFNDSKSFLAVFAILGLSWTPFMEPVNSFFVKTIGFTLLYISFGILLMYFILSQNINNRLNYLFGYRVVNLISKIGYCSYSIYIIHVFINTTFERILEEHDIYCNSYIAFFATSAMNILAGMVMTYKIEAYFLSLRNKYFPSRV
jgi:peptidoglycan/LPS O-acetylase OafA/YrhL